MKTELVRIDINICSKFHIEMKYEIGVDDLYYYGGGITSPGNAHHKPEFIPRREFIPLDGLEFHLKYPIENMVKSKL